MIIVTRISWVYETKLKLVRFESLSKGCLGCGGGRRFGRHGAHGFLLGKTSSTSTATDIALRRVGVLLNGFTNTDLSEMYMFCTSLHPRPIDGIGDEASSTKTHRHTFKTFLD
jgi:hypothetical protein